MVLIEMYVGANLDFQFFVSKARAIKQDIMHESLIGRIRQGVRG